MRLCCGHRVGMSAPPPVGRLPHGRLSTAGGQEGSVPYAGGLLLLSPFQVPVGMSVTPAESTPGLQAGSTSRAPWAPKAPQAPTSRQPQWLSSAGKSILDDPSSCRRLVVEQTSVCRQEAEASRSSRPEGTKSNVAKLRNKTRGPVAALVAMSPAGCPAPS